MEGSCLDLSLMGYCVYTQMRAIAIARNFSAVSQTVLICACIGMQQDLMFEALDWSNC